jgi:LmbE family N-acetylglucosaminyl deacetylase
LDGVAAQERGALMMRPLQLGASHEALGVLCLGAHSDDIEIGCGGTLLRWLGEYAQLNVTWAVASAVGDRAVEARRSARALLKGATRLDLVLGDLPDAHLPAHYGRAKAWLREVAHVCPQPDVILTHRLEDRHQDHRLLAELTAQTWRDHLVLAYEIPKYEGDLGQPALFVPLPRRIAERKTRHLLKHFASQRGKDWFTASTFEALMRLRGVECRAPEGWAEAFHVRKAVL